MNNESKLEVYFRELRELEYVFDQAFNLLESNSGKKVSDWRIGEGQLIFTKIMFNVWASLRLLPKSKYFSQITVGEIWDVPSVGLLTRAVMEGYTTFIYIAVENITPEESELRRLIWFYHGQSERLKCLQSNNPKTEKIPELELDVSNQRNHLRKNPLFQTLEREAQEKILSRRKVLLKTHSTIAKDSGINEDYFKAVYRYTSQYVHTTSFATSQLNHLRLDTDETYNLFITLARYLVNFTATAIIGYCQLWKIDRDTLTADLKKIILEKEWMLKNWHKDV